MGRLLCCLGRQEEPTRDTVKDMRSFIAAEDMWQSLTGDSEKYYELREGDILLIEEGEPHQISNIGTETAVITWSCAPHA